MRRKRCSRTLCVFPLDQSVDEVMCCRAGHVLIPLKPPWKKAFSLWWVDFLLYNSRPCCTWNDKISWSGIPSPNFYRAFAMCQALSQVMSHVPPSQWVFETGPDRHTASQSQQVEVEVSGSESNLGLPICFWFTPVCTHVHHNLKTKAFSATQWPTGQYFCLPSQRTMGKGIINPPLLQEKKTNIHLG